MFSEDTPSPTPAPEKAATAAIVRKVKPAPKKAKKPAPKLSKKAKAFAAKKAKKPAAPKRGRGRPPKTDRYAAVTGKRDALPASITTPGVFDFCAQRPRTRAEVVAFLGRRVKSLATRGWTFHKMVGKGMLKRVKTK